MIRRFFLLIVLISLLVSCNNDNDQNNQDKDFSSIENPRDRWEAYGITDYMINERISCFCGGVLQWDLVVKNNIKSEVIFDQTISNQTESEILERARTINDVFDFIETIDINNVASFVVEYNPTYGFPTLVSIDYDLNISDDEIVYIYSEFNPLD
jgi:hypothetical protein